MWNTNLAYCLQNIDDRTKKPYVEDRQLKIYVAIVSHAIIKTFAAGQAISILLICSLKTIIKNIFSATFSL